MVAIITTEDEIMTVTIDDLLTMTAAMIEENRLEADTMTDAMIAITIDVAMTVEEDMVTNVNVNQDVARLPTMIDVPHHSHLINHDISNRVLWSNTTQISSFHFFSVQTTTKIWITVSCLSTIRYFNLQFITRFQLFSLNPRILISNHFVFSFRPQICFSNTQIHHIRLVLYISLFQFSIFLISQSKG